MVCLKEGDQTLSGEIALEGSWEREEVGFIIRAMRTYSQAVFVGKGRGGGSRRGTVFLLLDGGCNIGMYTMMVAAMDRKVIAVDVLLENIDHIKTSLQIINKTEKVEFVLNAISDKSETLYPKLETVSNGGSSFVSRDRSGAVGERRPSSS